MSGNKYKEWVVYKVANTLGMQHLLEFTSRQEAIDYAKVEDCLNSGHLMKATLLLEGMRRKHGLTKSIKNTQGVLRTLRRKRDG